MIKEEQLSSSQHYFTYGMWSFEELKAKLVDDKIKLTVPKTGSFLVSTNSSRIRCLKRSQKCVRCDRIGSIWLLQSHSLDQKPHLNLWAVDPNGELVIMTQDHITPKSKGGTNKQSNLQTMCGPCNWEKGNREKS